MKYLKFSFFLLIALALTNCKQDDQISTETSILNLNEYQDVSFLIKVVDEQNQPISGVRLESSLMSNSWESDGRGIILMDNLDIPVDGLPVALEKNGMMKQVKRLKGAPDSRGTIEVTMTNFQMQSQIPAGLSGEISAGGQLTLPSGLVDANNNPYSGEVTVQSYYYNPDSDDFLNLAPGNMTAVGADNQPYTLQSFGMYAIELFDPAGNELQIPAGQTATIHFPIPTIYAGNTPNEIPLWSMDENSGKWIEEGMATLQGDHWEAEVSHFSWWNIDANFEPVTICMDLHDLNNAPIANFTYLVSSTDLNIHYATGTTDNNGSLCVEVPNGEPIVMRVAIDNNLSEPTNLGTFTNPEDLGIVIINEEFFHVTGQAVDCNGASVNNAIVTYTLNGQLDYTLTDENGNFKLSLSEKGELKTQLFETIANLTSEELTIQISSGQNTYDLGGIALCEEFDPGQPTPVAGNLSTDVTWVSGRTYLLFGRVTVEPGVTLTIEPGVVVKGQPGEGVNASFLMVARGGKLLAEGTEASPIIFTSALDEIQPGAIVSPNLSEKDQGLWGGVMLLGNAPVSDEFNADGKIEGLIASDPLVYYGGNDPDDNSGVLRYVSIRHSGVNIGAGNELNGLTLAGVGAGTTIDKVEVIGGLDDGFECIGGTVDLTNLVVMFTGDDGYDVDQGYDGTFNNFIYRGQEDANHAMEIDGPQGTINTNGTSIFQNGSLKGSGMDVADLEMIVFRNNAKSSVQNCYFFDFNFQADIELNDDQESVNYFDGLIIISGNEFNLAAGSLADVSNDIAPSGNDAAFDAQFAAENTVVTQASVGADKSVFNNWTWADNVGWLNDF